jgi:hypothetical protein
MYRKSLLVILGLAFIPAAGLAQDKPDEEVTPRTKQMYLEPHKKIFIEPKQTLIDKGMVGWLAAVSVGYDNNTWLDSRREGDMYTQQFLRGTFVSSLSEKTGVTASYEVMNLMYAGESKLDVIRNGVSGEIDHALTENLNLSGGYAFDAIEYIQTGVDDYTEHELGGKLKHMLGNKMFQTLGYGLSYRDYSRRYNRTTSALVTTKNRKDVRNTVDYEIGKYFAKDMVKLTFQYFNNNSNDKYLNYYDYDSYRLGAAFTHIFNDKLSGYASASRQYRDFRSRTLINDAGAHERDKTYLINTALYYAYNKSTTFGLSYTYRQNRSNEPSERYSGSLIALTTYYRF